ncbi:MAG: type II toxin-antitoxin system YoeB family toxin [Oscillospiraceae bacterium]|nr:type II toxin-antitoxin system YoeB family toxin [Oscillospiraceae bacterium]
MEALIGNNKGLLSRRINIKHRLVYGVFANEKYMNIISCGRIMIFRSVEPCPFQPKPARRC